MEPTEVPSQSEDIIKISTSHYEFGANLIDLKEVDEAPVEEALKNNHVVRKVEKRQRDRKIDPHVETSSGPQLETFTLYLWVYNTIVYHVNYHLN
ncbi:hypothetical protein Vadar_028916 [Vaccinium darrowii]|uniref:Uncharacterized protein n=1 Tax=Vaccinium darrowii TaxID=229202 RepID=A0ACB7ZG57_9ERIC|nr:hypothetical protein Vadar_028916 [Vaccinium darrowii]